MRIDVLTLFPHMITDYCSSSIIGIAQKNKIIDISAHNPRDFTEDKHNCVDDTAYGGGPGMVLSPQPFFDCFEHTARNINTQILFEDQAKSETKNLSDLNLEELKNGKLSHPENRDYEVIITSPTGKTLNQDLAKELSSKKNLIFLCGRYEGYDERIKNLATMEISLGDFVLSGGELAALSIIDSTLRLVPGVLGDIESAGAESFEVKNYLEELTKREVQELLDKTGIKSRESLEKLQLLEYPQYTRPKDFRGQKVPEVLQSGDHKKILLWRLEQAIEITKAKRPDLISDHLKSSYPQAPKNKQDMISKMITLHNLAVE